MTGNIRSLLFGMMNIFLMEMERKKEIPAIVIQVGAKIRATIKEKGLKVRIVAHDADLDIEALRRYMAGKQIMGIDKLYRIAQALGVEIVELFK